MSSGRFDLMCGKEDIMNAKNDDTAANNIEGLPLLTVGLLVFFLIASTVQGARIKDITTVRGVRKNHLYGFGIVVGLDGTGGGDFTGDVMSNMLSRQHVGRDVSEMEADNIASVMVTADLPPFAQEGTELDMLVSAMDESSSLRGGTLLLTTLKGADGEVYAVGQGPLSVSGFSFGEEAAEVQQNHPTVGRVPGGAVVEKEIKSEFLERSNVTLALNDPDFVTAKRIAEVVNEKSDARARVDNPGKITLDLETDGDEQGMMSLIAELETLEVTPDQKAEVVINERTGTVIAGSSVSLSAVAIAHGNLTVITREDAEVSQPGPFSAGETEVVPRSEIEVVETPVAEGGMTVLSGGPTVSDVARALNLLGASPQDIISIFQALKEGGALHADLRIM